MNQKGFTLVELVVVIVVLGILAAVAVPKFVDLSTEATDASKKGVKSSVKAAFALAIAKNSATGNTGDDIYPTITDLAAAVDGDDITAETTGVGAVINKVNYIVATYIDDNCSTATTDADDTVKCVGDITP